jgi:ketosteroid isomerase-like protein
MHNPDRPHDAASALAAHLDLITRDIERWLALFADDAIVEFPYAASFAMPTRLTGRSEIRAHFARTPDLFRELRFRDLRLHAIAPHLAFAEVHGSATIATTGRAYEQDYVMLLEWRGGAIVRYREYWDATVAMRAFGGDDQVRAQMGAA